MNKVVFKNGIEKKYLWGLKVSIINNTNLNLSINSGKLLIKTKTNNIEVKILYIENYSETYGVGVRLIKDVPFNISSLTQVAKVAIFDLSEKLSQMLLYNLRLNENPNVEIILTDLDGNNYAQSIELKGALGN